MYPGGGGNVAWESSPVQTSSDRTTNLSVTEYSVLGLLDLGGGQSGYDLLKRVERNVGYMWAPAKTGLYTVLGRLEAAGLASSRTAKERGPTKQVYSITAAGRAALRAWLTDSTLEITPPRDPFLVKLFFAKMAAPASGCLSRAHRPPARGVGTAGAGAGQGERRCDRADCAAVRARARARDTRLV